MITTRMSTAYKNNPVVLEWKKGKKHFNSVPEAIQWAKKILNNKKIVSLKLF